MALGGNNLGLALPHSPCRTTEADQRRIAFSFSGLSSERRMVSKIATGQAESGTQKSEGHCVDWTGRGNYYYQPQFKTQIQRTCFLSLG